MGGTMNQIRSREVCSRPGSSINLWDETSHTLNSHEDLSVPTGRGTKSPMTLRNTHSNPRISRRGSGHLETVLRV